MEMPRGKVIPKHLPLAKKKPSLLLALPLELFEQIIQDLVESVGIERAAKYRRVNKTFAVHVDHRVIEIVSKQSFTEILAGRKLRRLALDHLGALLVRKVLNHNKKDEMIVEFAKVLVEKAMECMQVNQKYHERFVVGVCHTMGALRLPNFIENLEHKPSVQKYALEKFLPVVASAVDATRAVKKPLQDPLEFFKSPCQYMPHALSATVATGNTGLLKKYLSWILNHYKIKSSYWTDHKNTIFAKKIGDALGTAIRLHENDAGNILFDFLKDQPRFSDCVPRELREWLFKDAVRHGNTALFDRVLDFKPFPSLARLSVLTPKTTIMTSRQVTFLLQYGSKSIVTMVLRDGRLDPNTSILPTTPLCVTLQHHRQDLARVLLRHGADLYVQLKNGKTILWDAIKEGHSKDVRFLLACGADPYKAAPSEPRAAISSELTDFRDPFLFKIAESKELRNLLGDQSMTLKDLRYSYWSWREDRFMF